MSEIRLIDANALRAKSKPMVYGQYGRSANTKDWYVSDLDIQQAPTEDAEVVRHGRWVNNGWEGDDGKRHRAGYRCSECAGKSIITYPNCPWCRAKMDAKEVT